MRNLLYIVALMMIIVWLIGFVGFKLGGLIHLFLVIAVIAGFWQKSLAKQ